MFIIYGHMIRLNNKSGSSETAPGSSNEKKFQTEQKSTVRKHKTKEYKHDLQHNKPWLANIIGIIVKANTN